MYTELPHAAIRGAAAHFLQWTRRRSRVLRPKEWLVDVRRRRVYESRHQYDVSRCVRVRLSDLLDAVAFELDHIFFTVGDVTLQQQLGVSMGGYLSPAMAMMVCMVAELHGRRVLMPNTSLASNTWTMRRWSSVHLVPCRLCLRVFVRARSQRTHKACNARSLLRGTAAACLNSTSPFAVE